MIIFNSNVLKFGGFWLGYGSSPTPPQPTIYHINVPTVQHGTVAVNPTEGPTGTLVTISTVPDTGYELDTISLTGAELINGNQFYIDGSDVTVNATFREASAVDVLYVNRLNDCRLRTDPFPPEEGGVGVKYYLYPYMTSFENQTQTPITEPFMRGNIWTGESDFEITQVVPSGIMPSSYAGMPQANHRLVDGNVRLNLVGILAETASLNEFTWGLWVKMPNDTVLIDSSMVMGCIGIWRYRTDTGAHLTLANAYQDTDSYAWGNATIEKLNGSTGTFYGMSNGSYEFGIHPSTNEWCYFATYFNRTTHTVEYYINGVIYFRLTNVPDGVFTYAEQSQGSGIQSQKNIVYKNSTVTPSKKCSYCEYVIYRGKHTAIPTAPYIATQYNINVAATQHGTVSVNPSSGSTGMLVTITVVPESGYELDSISLTGATLINANQFYIENSDVTVTATFVQSVNFRTVNINGLTWSAEDLNVNDGLGNDDIKEESYTFNGTTYSWCLYTITAAQRIAALYPGWHIATANEWVNLATYAGGWDVAGGKMKTAFGWKNSGNGTNELGFNGYPTGGWDTAIHHQATGITESARYIAIPVSGGSRFEYVGLSYLNNKLSASTGSRPSYCCLRLVKDHN